MALSVQTYQFLSQQNLLRHVDVSGGPEGPKSAVSYWLVPANGYFNGQRAPHSVETELGDVGYSKTTVEGLEYYLVPEESSNTPGLLSHYAQRTGPSDLANPIGGINAARASFEHKGAAAVSVAPDAVKKYVDDNDAAEEARKTQSERDQIVDQAVTVSPAREPSEGKLVEVEADDKKEESKPTSTQKPSSDRK